MRAAAWIAGLAALVLFLYWMTSRRPPPPDAPSASKLEPPDRWRTRTGPPPGTGDKALERLREPAGGVAAPDPEAAASGQKTVKRTPVPPEEEIPVLAGAPASRSSGRLAILEEILAHKSDNDPRLDTAFDDLSDGEKRRLRKRYAKTPPEGRNKRGTIVYVLGRNLKTEEDWAFLRKVVAESPCLSLADCSRKRDSADPHQDIGMDVTLAYPSLVALRQAERAAAGQAGQALKLIRAARDSQVPIVADKARRIEARLGR